MIKLLSTISEKEMAFANTGCLGVRALGPVLAYGLEYDFLQAWAQYDEEKVTSFITKFYGAVTIFSSLDADKEELEEFVKVIGNNGLTDNFHDGECYAMKLDNGKNCKALPVTNCNLIENSNLHMVYDIITKCHGIYTPSSFDEWYVDINHRMRHNTAKSYLLEVDGEVVSTLLVLSITEDAIFVTGVSTLEEYRGKHYAHTLIKNVCDEFSDKAVYLFCKEEKVAFYEKAGFKNVEKIFTI